MTSEIVVNGICMGTTTRWGDCRDRGDNLVEISILRHGLQITIFASRYLLVSAYSTFLEELVYMSVEA